MKNRRLFRYAKFAGLGLALGLAALAATALAEDGGAQLYVQAPTGVEIKEGGTVFQVDVLASGVSNLAAFQFSLQYNPSILRYVGVKEATFLGSTGRPVQCADPRQEQDSKKVERIRFACATLAGPVSLGGKAGPNGAGTLAQVTFAPVGGGNTPLDLTEGILVAAEIDAEGNPAQIPSSMQGSSLDVIGSGGGFPWLILGGALAGIVVVGLVGGGVLLSRRRMR
jgi:hypothetical protein